MCPPSEDVRLDKIDGFPAAVAHALEKLDEPVRTLADLHKRVERNGTTIFADRSTEDVVYLTIVRLVGHDGYLATSARNAVMRQISSEDSPTRRPAMAKQKGRSIANGEQQLIPEMAPTKIPEIHTAAKAYAKVRDARSALSVEEKEARDHLAFVMKKNELVNYEYGDLIVTLDVKEKAVVTAKSAEPEGEVVDE